MGLEQNLIGEIQSSGLEMYTGMPEPVRLPENISPAFGPSDCRGRSPSHPHFGGTFSRLKEGELRLIKPTETFSLKLDDVCISWIKDNRKIPSGWKL